MLKELFEKELNITLSQSQGQAFGIFYRFLTENNAKFNLTAITDKEEVYIKHFLDSCFALPYLSEGATLLDAGSGGGFPTIPLAIVRPDLKITSLDSNAKKSDFVSRAAKLLNLNVTALCQRAESLKLKEAFDAATARALSSASALLEVLAPLTKIGGKIILYKGKEAEDFSAAQNALLLENPLEIGYSLPLYGERKLLIFEKKVLTPPVYPRPNGKPFKKPL